MRSVLSSHNKKGQMGGVNSIILAIVVFVILVGVAYLIGSKFLTTMTASSTEYNQTKAAFETLDTVVDFLPIIVIVAIAGIVLFLVYRFGGQGARV